MNRLVALFFLSGAAGLVYQSIWSRELHRIFGTSQFAIATVLAAFMTGLTAGSALGARYAHKVKSPLRAYAILEAAIGVFALAFPGILDLVEPLYLWFWHAYSPSVTSFGVFQFVVLGALLLLPTACMGATLPILVQLPNTAGAGSITARLYAVNTAGAVFGTWLAGFWLLPGIGVWATTVAAALTNFALAGAAVWLERIREREAREREELLAVDAELRSLGVDLGPVDDGANPPPAEPTLTQMPPWASLSVAALAGFSSLVLEVAWFRLMSLILGASTYAFTVMLLAFLLGIAAGGEAAGSWADRLAARRRVWIGLAAAQVGVALLTWSAMWGWKWLPLAFAKAFFAIEPNADVLLWPVKCGIAMMVMAPPAFLMGATFPLLVRAATTRVGTLASAVGRVYAANTLGSLAGAFLAGFVLLPSLHVRGTVIFAVAVNLLAAWVAAVGGNVGLTDVEAPSPARGRGLRLTAGFLIMVGAITGAAAFAPPWDPMLMTTGIYKYVDNMSEPTQAEIQADMIDRYDLKYYSEGLSSVVTVAQNRKTGNVWLANNGKIDASSTTDMPTQILVAHLPFLFTGDRAKSAVVIGLASGITLGAATLHPELERIDVVEIEPSIREATEFFRKQNHDALYDPRVRLLANDGRNQLLLTPPGTYDVIVCEPSNPWLTGVSNLFTREFFEMGKERLAKGGVWAQWVQMYGMDNRDLKAVMKTFGTVFPYVQVFATIEDADLVMVGSERPLELTVEAAEFLRTRTPQLQADMDTIELTDRWLLLSTWLFEREEMMGFAGGAPLNTDDNLLVEFSAPRNLHRETSTENFSQLRRRPMVPVEAAGDANGLVQLARAYAKREQIPRALVALKLANERDPARQDIADLQAAYLAMLDD